MLRRDFAPPGQPASSGNRASAALISHRARRPEVLALLGSKTGQLLPSGLMRLPRNGFLLARPAAPQLSRPWFSPARLVAVHPLAW